MMEDNKKTTPHFEIHLVGFEKMNINVQGELGNMDVKFKGCGNCMAKGLADAMKHSEEFTKIIFQALVYYRK